MQHTFKFVVACWVLACCAVADAAPRPWPRASLSRTCAGRADAPGQSLQALLCALYAP